MPVIYLLHFSRPYKGSRHYMGASSDVRARLERHREGRGSRFLAGGPQAGYLVARGADLGPRRLQARKQTQRAGEPRAAVSVVLGAFCVPEGETVTRPLFCLPVMAALYYVWGVQSLESVFAPLYTWPWRSFQASEVPR